MAYVERYFQPGEWTKFDLESKARREPEARKRDRIEAEIEKISNQIQYEDKRNGRT